MIEHPVPQNITEYQFHLIGNMTIKQFLILLVGVVLAFAFYSTNLLDIIKWPFIILIVGGAVALAFVPFEERTLDQWLVNFIRAIYRPTKFYWRRLAPTPDYFGYEKSTNQQAAPVVPTNQPQRQRQVSAYLSSIQSQNVLPKVADPLDLFQDETDNLTALFDSVDAASNVTPGKEKPLEKPDLQVRARPLGSKRGIVFSTLPNTETSAKIQLSQQPQTPVFQGADPHQSPVFTMEPLQKTVTSKNTKTILPTHPTGNARTTDVQQVSVQKSDTEALPVSTPEKPAPAQTEENQPQQTQVKSYTNQTTKLQSETAAIPIVFSKELPFPSLPDKPNLLLGMVHDSQKNIIPGAIVEILDTNGNTVRAMKTNNLGQFYISTPLKKGQYTIETEAQDQSFPIFSLEVNDTILDPVDIQALA